MQDEIWKDVQGYEGFYQVSSFGRVKSLARVVKRRTSNYKVKELVLKHCVNNKGYRMVSLTKNSKGRSKEIHKLVAIAFLNHTPCGYKKVVNHINHNKLDNRVDNLEIISNRENTNQIHLPSASKYVGVVKHKDSPSWYARIRVNGKKKYLGAFKEEYDAHLACQAELKRIGEAYEINYD